MSLLTNLPHELIKTIVEYLDDASMFSVGIASKFYRKCVIELHHEMYHRNQNNQCCSLVKNRGEGYPQSILHIIKSAIEEDYHQLYVWLVSPSNNIFTTSCAAHLAEVCICANRVGIFECIYKDNPTISSCSNLYDMCAKTGNVEILRRLLSVIKEIDKMGHFIDR